MSKTLVTRCDRPGCEAIKGAANHWFRMRVVGEGTIMILSASHEPVSGDRDYCGVACLFKAIQAEISQSNEKESPDAAPLD